MTVSRNEIIQAIGITYPTIPPNIEYNLLDSKKEDGFTRHYIEYDSYQDKVKAFLLLPDQLDNNPAILIHHQHNGERHFGKSEVCGLAGNSLQAFGPELAKRRFVVLAPDSICFEERRKDAHGTQPLSNDADFLQHYNEMCYRIIKGDCLMKNVLYDAMNAITLLSGLPYVDTKKIGSFGHSYGGNTTLFLSAIDERIAFSCASGSACTYENRMANYVGIEMASVIPNFHSKYDIYDLVSCIAPRRLLIVSAEDDKYSKDATEIVEKVSPAYADLHALNNLYHKRYHGGHGLTRERFDYIIEWLTSHCDGSIL